MKVVLTGATGFIGGGVLRRCLRLPSITSLVVLSRRELPDAPADPKLKVVIHDDFLRYPDSVLSHTAGADACIWCLGNTPSQVAKLSTEDAHVYECEYPLAAAKALLPTDGKPFRFVYMSGAAAERDQNKALWMFERPRHLKGETESSLLALARSTPNFTAVITRPASVYTADSKAIIGWLSGRHYAIHLDELAAVSVEAAVGSVAAGANDEKELGETLVNAAMVARGHELLAATP